jgi:hypothetical protein
MKFREFLNQDLTPLFSKKLSGVSSIIPGKPKFWALAGVFLFITGLFLPAYTSTNAQKSYFGQETLVMGPLAFFTDWNAFFAWLCNIPLMVGLTNSAFRGKFNVPILLFSFMALIIGSKLGLSTLILPINEGTSSKLDYEATYGAYCWVGALLLNFISQLKTAKQ